jgi:hypothetical protein
MSARSSDTKEHKSEASEQATQQLSTSCVGSWGRLHFTCYIPYRGTKDSDCSNQARAFCQASKRLFSAVSNYPTALQLLRTTS